MKGWIDALGLLAGMLTTIAFLPQVLKIYRTKSGKDISRGMILIFSLGVLLWLIYGIAIGSLPLILANAFTLVLSLAIIALKVRYSRPKLPEGQDPRQP
jgi:MtN3 and saliva related transmembrane protein